MAIIKQSTAPFRFCGTVYQLSCNLVVIEKLQDKYGSIENAWKATAKASDLADIAKIFIDNAIDIHNEDDPIHYWEKPSINKIKMHVNYYDINEALLRAFRLSLPDKDEDDEPQKNGEPSDRRDMVVQHRSIFARLFRKRGSKSDIEKN